MDIDDDDMDQAPSSSTGVKGDKKRFEVKKVRKVKNCFPLLIDDFRNICEISLDNKGHGWVQITILIHLLAFCIFSGMQLLSGLGVS